MEQKNIPQHIEVKKIVPNYEKRETIKDPTTGKHIKARIEGYDVLVEGIRIDEIKSFREYFKSTFQKTAIEGDVTILYLKGNPNIKASEMMIQENVDDFSNRVGMVRLPEQ